MKKYFLLTLLFVLAFHVSAAQDASGTLTSGGTISLPGQSITLYVIPGTA